MTKEQWESPGTWQTVWGGGGVLRVHVIQLLTAKKLYAYVSFSKDYRHSGDEKGY